MDSRLVALDARTGGRMVRRGGSAERERGCVIGEGRPSAHTTRAATVRGRRLLMLKRPEDRRSLKCKGEK